MNIYEADKMKKFLFTNSNLTAGGDLQIDVLDNETKTKHRIIIYKSEILALRYVLNQMLPPF